MAGTRPADLSPVHRFLRFSVVGGLGTLIDVALAIVMTKLHGGVA